MRGDGKEGGEIYRHVGYSDEGSEVGSLKYVVIIDEEREEVKRKVVKRMSSGFLLGVFACDDDSASEAVARDKSTLDLAIVVGVNEEVVSHGFSD